MRPKWSITLEFSTKRNAEIVRRWLREEHGVDVLIEKVR